MSFEEIKSWGRICKGLHKIQSPAFIDNACAEVIKKAAPTIAFGCGRSYGDVCLNKNGRLIATRFLDRIICANWQTGLLRAEAGLTFDDLLQISVPRGWFPPVSPGTKFVSLGGAVANDIHGKNHKSTGTIGCHVKSIGLARSNGDVLELSPLKNSGLFAATIGGLGLTGLILWVELQLKAINSSYFETETLSVADLDTFFCLAEESREWDYSAAWVDCLAKGKKLGRGLFIRGRHAESGDSLFIATFV